MEKLDYGNVVDFFLQQQNALAYLCLTGNKLQVVYIKKGIIAKEGIDNVKV